MRGLGRAIAKDTNGERLYIGDAVKVFVGYDEGVDDNYYTYEAAVILSDVPRYSAWQRRAPMTNRRINVRFIWQDREREARSYNIERLANGHEPLWDIGL